MTGCILWNRGIVAITDRRAINVEELVDSMTEVLAVVLTARLRPLPPRATLTSCIRQNLLKKFYQNKHQRDWISLRPVGSPPLANDICIEKIQRVITKHHLDGEIIAADNSTDRMHEVARVCAPVAAAGTGVSRSVAGANR